MSHELVQFDRARRALALATKIDEVKDIRDKAEALRQYARQAGQGLEMQNQCAEIKLRAERRAGEMLAETPKEPGKRTDLTSSHDVTRLQDVGISRQQSSRWQRIADIPEPDFERKITEDKARRRELTSAGMLRLSKELERQSRKEEKLAHVPAPDDERFQLICGDLRNVWRDMEPESVDYIITDPPYPREYLPLYETLAEASAYLLKPGGSAIVMVGQSYLPEIMTMMCRHLHYQWTLAYLTPGGQSAQLWQRKVNTFWKPLLWFVKGDYEGDWIGDVARSNVNDNDKRFHEWGQSESGMADIIDRFTYPGDLICDPFCGGGVIGVVALSMDRRFIGVDIDAEAIETTRRRIGKLTDGIEG